MLTSCWGGFRVGDGGGRGWFGSGAPPQALRGLDTTPKAVHTGHSMLCCTIAFTRTPQCIWKNWPLPSLLFVRASLLENGQHTRVLEVVVK